jgi:hypothetical protein
VEVGSDLSFGPVADREELFLVVKQLLTGLRGVLLVLSCEGGAE